MARIELAPEVLGDFDRFFKHIAEFDTDFVLAVRNQRESGYKRVR